MLISVLLNLTYVGFLPHLMAVDPAILFADPAGTVVIEAQSVSDPDGSVTDREHCPQFLVTEDQVRRFFINAEQVTAREIHDEFDYISCYAKGLLQTGTGEYAFEVRAGGLGRLLSPDGTVLLFGCRESCCRELPGFCLSE